MNFQPYKRCHPAEDALAILHCLSNRDKHRVINPVLISTTDFHLPGGALDNVGVENFIFPSDKRLEIGAEVFRVPLTSLREPDMEMQGHSTPDIVLLQGDPIIKRLDDVASRVTQILSRIEPLF